MLTRTDVVELIRDGENSEVEFKVDTIDTRQLAKELVALANFQGGHVILGVDDAGTVVGVTREKLEEWVMAVCRDKIRPPIVPRFQMFRDIEAGKSVAVVTVERSYTVHHVWHNKQTYYYLRVGSTSRPCSQEELARLFQQRGMTRVEIQPVSGSSMETLDRRRLVDYFTRVRQQEVPDEEDGEAWTKLLINTDFLAENGDPVPATLAGLLIFGKRPTRFLPHAAIDATAFPGREKDLAARERASLRSPLVALFSKGELVENGLVEQAIDFVRRNTGVVADLEGDVRRRERPDYPAEVVREAVVNAVVHRDYLLSATTIELSIYEDRLEIVSPGRLPNGITPERMRAGCRAARNQLLKDVLRDYGYLENIGMGVPRKMIKGMREHNGTEPDLEEDGELFRVRLWRRPQET